MTDWNAHLERPTPDQICVRGVEYRTGDRVVLRPLGRADIFDMALEGKSAAIESNEQDFEGRIYLAVVVDDDPGRDLGRLRQPGHRFFFGVDEIEPVGRVQGSAPSCISG
jgi:hypothetical protein